jgi:hypothetical protein
MVVAMWSRKVKNLSVSWLRAGRDQITILPSRTEEKAASLLIVVYPKTIFLFHRWSIVRQLV